MKTKYVLKSMTIGGVLLLLLHWISNAMGWDLPHEKADQVVGGLLDLVGFGMAIAGRLRKGDLHLIGNPRLVESKTYPRGPAYMLMMAGIAAMMLAGCGATSQRVKPKDISSSGVPFSSTVIESESGSVTLHAPTIPQWSSLDSGGFESTSGQPSGLAFISQFGVGMANPADASFDHLEMEFTDEGIPKSLIIDGFNAAISGPILAKAQQLDRIVAIVHELEETDRQTFNAFMDTIADIAPDLFDALKAALGMP